MVRHPKQKAIDMIVNETYKPEDLLSVSYEKMGKCILAQGSKLIHHVTRVESAPEDRISLIISLAPRNAYHPEVTIFHSMKNLDMNAPKGVPEYEYFRQKSWHCRVSLLHNNFLILLFIQKSIVDHLRKNHLEEP